MINETKIDKFGRVLIPKAMRQDFGLEPGSRLLIEEKDDGLSLRRAADEPELVLSGKVLVAKVQPTGDIKQAVDRHRRRRLDKFTGQEG